MASEKRLIDANALLAELDKFANPMPNQSGYEFLHGIATAITEIEDAPTVEAVEVVHGKWKNKQTNSIFTWHLECSVCGADYHTHVGYNYCPNCGAKMDGDGNG